MPKHLEDLDVLIWLPGQPEPVLAGQLRSEDGSTSFVYDPGYLLLKHAIPIFQADLPLIHRKHYPAEPHQLAPSLRDALPDRWGRRAIAAKLSNPPRPRIR
ncbi:HipA N-terminal domain-containing protein, partial [Sulfitobacter sp. 915]|uniref:HipA N-terminal domain-containing protein n=1 Tax=Sulfitobacter sp. 915 TaxID=3368558 RepID=UPI003745FB6F